MRHCWPRTIQIVWVLFSLSATSMVLAQTQQPTPPAQPASAGAAAHYDRMAAAKTVFLKNAGGSDIPFNVISRNFEGWSHYLLVDSPDNADLVIEIKSPGEGSADKDKDSGKNKTNVTGGAQQNSQPQPTIDVIVLTVYDKNKRPLWIAREEPKFAIRHKAQEERLVEAAQKLFSRLHDHVEPPVKP